MGSKWTHAICTACWEQYYGPQPPYRLTNSPQEPCCFCGGLTSAGIYVRESPEVLRCRGDHSVVV